MDRNVKTELLKTQKSASKSGIAKPKLAIECKPIATLRPNPQNPRLHEKRQIRQIARSIEVFGFNIPVLIDARGELITGHGRVLAAQHLGMTHVPTILIEHLKEAQARAFMIADNRLTENSDWNDRLLAQQIKALSELELDFSLETIGFEIGEIDLMIEGLSPASGGAGDPADVIPDSSDKPQVTEAGELWILGGHQVHCGDARNDSSYSLLTQGRRARMIFADPPYNDPIDGYVTGFGKVHHREFTVGSGELSVAEFSEFLTNILRNLAQQCIDGALLYVCMDWRHSEELLAAARSVKIELRNVCVCG